MLVYLTTYRPHHRPPSKGFLKGYSKRLTTQYTYVRTYSNLIRLRTPILVLADTTRDLWQRGRIPQCKLHRNYTFVALTFCHVYVKTIHLLYQNNYTHSTKRPPLYGRFWGMRKSHLEQRGWKPCGQDLVSVEGISATRRNAPRGFNSLLWFGSIKFLVRCAYPYRWRNGEAWWRLWVWLIATCGNCAKLGAKLQYGWRC